MRYFIELAYNGSAYHGWQIQPNAITVQEVLNKAFSTLLRSEINIVGAGRTDTGVHASYFVAHFDLDFSVENTQELLKRVNAFLPHHIVVYSISEVYGDMHSRFNATSRTYKYYIHQQKNPFLGTFSYFYRPVLNLEDMNEACSKLIEYKDFTSFSKLHTDVNNNLCKIEYAKWEFVGQQLVFTVSANRFLRNMVRAIVGTCLEVGVGKMIVAEFCQVIEDKDRSKAGASVPGHALFLYDIQYEGFTRNMKPVF